VGDPMLTMVRWSVRRLSADESRGHDPTDFDIIPWSARNPLEEHVITSELLKAYLACPMKCYLQSTGEKCSENKYAAWYRAKDDSYRRAGIKRLTTIFSHALADRQIDPRQLKTARWQLAYDQAFEANELSASIHALQRVLPKAGSPEVTPIRLVHSNRPSRSDRMTAAFDAYVLSGSACTMNKFISGS